MTKHSKHKRILALLLSVLMIVSVMTVGISANTDDTIVIDEASDWNAYKQADGSYLLDGSKTYKVSASMETLSTSFNGNGATVNTTVPLFAAISNTSAETLTIENLTIDGSITSGTYVGALAITSSGNINITNVTNSANVTSTGGGVMTASGFISITYNGVHNFKDCVNEGNIMTTSVSETYAAGFVAYHFNGQEAMHHFINCVNKGSITGSTDAAAYSTAAGLVGYHGKWGYSTFVGCGNTGDITASWIAAGILAREWDRPNSFDYCYNTGTITATGITSGEAYTSGITFGLCYHTTYLGNISFCWNSGDIKAPDGVTTVGQIVGETVKGTTPETISSILNNNFYSLDVKDSNGDVIPAFANNPDATSNTFYFADIASGKLAYDINTAAGAQVFFQNLTEGASLPTTNAADGTVVKIEDNYYSLRLTTADEASAKIADTAAYSGLRFTTTVNAADLAKLPAEAEITYGTRITPTHYLKAVTSFDKLVKDDTCVDVIVESDDVFFEGTSFRGSIVGIKSDNFDMDYSAIGFAKIGDVTVWSTTYSTRNINEIAFAAYNDRSATQGGDYKNVITKAELVIEGKPYSPYTEPQLGILKGYIG